MYRSLTGTPRDVALLVARLLLAYIMVMHSWKKIDAGLFDTAAVFAKFGIPLAIGAASFTIVVELVLRRPGLFSCQTSPSSLTIETLVIDIDPRVPKHRRSKSRREYQAKLIPYFHVVFVGSGYDVRIDEHQVLLRWSSAL